MRKHQQKQILNIITTLKEAKTELKNLLIKKEFSVALQLLEDCQEGAVQVGEFIENLEGEGTQTVELLEAYYESLYRFGEIIETAEGVAIKHLKKLLFEIENVVKAELKPNRIEVVFLPYNASMWDSLESIWLAAKNDPQYDVYCVPIPYYELNADGTFGQIHYEGAAFYSENIEITNWQEYDIKERSPDVIFTHYAYDDMARNATIHPDFYSKTLREHCEYLVHVPYFITHEDVVKTHNASLPGVLYANYVIVQSEEIRQSYIGHYKKFDKENKLNSFFGRAENKFIALGSPKLDKTINTKATECEVPLDWKRLIYKENGEKKKIVFYNTHMFEWLDGGEKYFKKIYSIFELFKKQENVVLWWRPHPNTELNFRTLRPDMLDEYIKTVQNYKNEGWGIYDDTPDLHRAIAWSDAYYGDMSSVVELYRVTGKPVMIQNTETNGLLETSNSLIATMSVYKNQMIYSFFFRNCFFFSELPFHGRKNEKTYLGHVPERPINKWRQWTFTTVHNDTLFLIPTNENTIVTYDFTKQSYEYFPLDLRYEVFEPFDSPMNFRNALFYGDTIFLIPSFYSAIVYYDFVDKKTVHCLELQSILNDINYKVNECKFLKYEFIDGKRILLPFIERNKILEFNLETFEYKVHTVGNGSGFVSINKHGDDYWLIERADSRIVKWNYITNKIWIFSDFPEDFDHISGKTLFPINSIFLVNDYLYAFAGYSNMSVKIDMLNGAITKLEMPEEYYSEYDLEPCFHAGILVGEKIYMQRNSGNSIIFEYDTISGNLTEFDYGLSSLSQTDMIRFSDDSICGMLESEMNKGGVQRRKQTTIGADIHNYIKQQLLSKGE